MYLNIFQSPNSIITYSIASYSANQGLFYINPNGGLNPSGGQVYLRTSIINTNVARFEVSTVLIWIKAKPLKVLGSAFNLNRFNFLLKIFISCCAISNLLFVAIGQLIKDMIVNPGVESSSSSFSRLTSRMFQWIWKFP